jgi:ligand-binding sensor domain-containing protein
MKSMTRRMLLLLILLLLGGAFLTACGGGEDADEERTSSRDDDEEEPAEEEEEEEEVDEEEADEAADEAEEPVADEEEASEPEAESAVTVDTAAFVTAGSKVSGISIGHPADWVVDVTEIGGITVASSQAFMDSDIGVAESGGIVALNSYPLEFLAGEKIDETDATTVVPVLAELILDESDEETVMFALMDGPTAVALAGYDAATMTYAVTDSAMEGTSTLQIIAVLDGTERVVFGLTGFSEDARAEVEPLVAAILETMVLSPPQVAEGMEEPPVETDAAEEGMEEGTAVAGIPSLLGSPQMFPDLPQTMQETGVFVYSNGNEVNDIAVYEQFVFGATDGGVTVWDYQNREQVAKLTTLEGMAHNVALSTVVCPLPEPRIAVGTRVGLSLIDPTTGDIENWNSENSGMGSAAGVESLACVPELNTLLVGYELDGIDVYDANSGSWTRYAPFDQLESGFATDIAVKGALEEIWIAHIAAVSVIRADGSIGYYDDENGLDNLETDAFEHFVDDIAVDDSGTVWFAQGGGLTRVEADGSFTFISSDEVPGWPFWSGADNLTVGPDGTLWTNTVFGGVCNYDQASNSCLTTFEDEEGMAEDFNNTIIVNEMGIFYGSDGEGISYFDGAAWNNFLTNDLAPSNSFRAIAQAADGQIWLGGDYGLVTFPAWDANSGWNEVDGVNNVTTLYPRINGMWVGTSNGAAFYEYETGEWTVLEAAEEPETGLYGSQVTSIVQDSRGYMWFGTNTGLTIWDGSSFDWVDLLNEEERAEERIPRYVHTLLVSGDMVWAGSTGALYRFNIADSEVTRWDENSGLPGFFPTVYDLSADNNGDLLIALDRGLYRFELDGSFTELFVADGSIRDIHIDVSGQWLVMTQGAGVYLFNNGEWRNVTAEVGLPSTTYNGRNTVTVDYLGALWIVSSDGGLYRDTP